MEIKGKHDQVTFDDVLSVQLILPKKKALI